MDFTGFSIMAPQNVVDLARFSSLLLGKVILKCHGLHLDFWSNLDMGTAGCLTDLADAVHLTIVIM